MQKTHMFGYKNKIMVAISMTVIAQLTEQH